MPEPGIISVVGQGRAAGAADVCRVALAATALRPTVAAALADSEQATRRVRDALSAAGVSGQNAATSTVTVQAEEDYMVQDGPKLVGYRAEHGLEVVLRDLASAGRVIGDAVAAWGEAVRHVWGVVRGGRRCGAPRPGPRGGMGDALRAGEQLAGLAGGALGTVRSVTETHAGDGRGPVPMAARAAGLAEIGLEPGDIDVGIALAVVWELR